MAPSLASSDPVIPVLSLFSLVLTLSSTCVTAVCARERTDHGDGHDSIETSADHTLSCMYVCRKAKTVTENL